MSENKQSAAEVVAEVELNEAELESVAGGTLGDALIDLAKAEIELGKLIIEAVTGN
ncbi:MAG TPA: hypothetical protein VF746_03505 [Longimicrobium sp.]|jgi:hypothetical protein